MKPLDKTDNGIIYELQREGRTTNAKLAEKLHISEASCWRKLKRLQENGIIEGYQAILNRRSLGFGVLSFVELSCSQHSEEITMEFENLICGCPYVMSCHNITGEADFLLKVVARDLDDYSQFVDQILRKIPGVTRIRSNLVLRELKSSSRLPEI